ncbi:uncharacterized protein B0P05DRAFT_592376 [Gilbertella persicaria]|uniref:uncharacterized protein n=1 Tax=Gilbertella persicaria TaxID=101096 RepID=UPI00222048F5|nr:uncharacterized protein B0P05DRAFT_592376 [Gilbertella persicaria]KAI8048029.1 hypothetical protein B0P05DRAFT_592376 [Gilbertella persicaria]
MRKRFLSVINLVESISIAKYDSQALPSKKLVTVRKVDGNHNHHLTSDARTYRIHRKPTADIYEEAVSLLQYSEMLNAKGVNYITRSDPKNLQQMNRMSSDTTSFMTHLQRKQYNELRRFPESIVVDATYESNCHLYALLNFVVAGTASSKERPDQSTIIPVASA